LLGLQQDGLSGKKGTQKRKEKNMKIRKGLNGGHYKPLSQSDIEKIHQTSLRIFSEVGVQVNFPEALELFKKAGAIIDD
jgi:trimethylamine--corrinoid protein Co-methyltransferase